MKGAGGSAGELVGYEPEAPLPHTNSLRNQLSLIAAFVVFACSSIHHTLGPLSQAKKNKNMNLSVYYGMETFVDYY